MPLDPVSAQIERWPELDQPRRLVCRAGAQRRDHSNTLHGSSFVEMHLSSVAAVELDRIGAHADPRAGNYRSVEPIGLANGTFGSSPKRFQRARQQNADTAGQPVTYTLLAVYFAGYLALASNADGLLANVLTIFPLTAPLVLPARSALVGVPLWEHVVAVVFVLATTYALVSVAGRIYGQGLLRTGPRLGVRAAWHLSHHS